MLFCSSFLLVKLIHLLFNALRMRVQRPEWQREGADEMDLESFSPPLTEKERAIASVLPLLHDHHDLVIRVRTCLPARSDHTAPWRRPVGEDDEFFWVELAERNRKRYRLDAVTQSLEKLNESGRPRALVMARALYSAFIEPWDRYLSEQDRLRYARAGLCYLATEIPGEMPDYHEPRLSHREYRNQEIARLLELGFSTRHISRLLHCSTVTIQAVREGRRVQHGVLEAIVTPT